MQKRFKSLEEQEELLVSRGVATDDDTRAILSREGYYAVVVGYKAPFLTNPNHAHGEIDRYREGTTFQHIYAAFIFDRMLRMTMLSYSMAAESTLKVLCAYAFEKHHRKGTQAYLEKTSYARDQREKGTVRRLINTFNQVIRQESPYDERTYLYDYMEELTKVPFWVITKAVDFGTVLEFCRCVTKDVQGDVVDAFEHLYEQSWGKERRMTFDGEGGLDARFMRIKDMRNLCAHDERLYCARFGREQEADLWQVCRDLRLVIDRDMHERMMGDVQRLLERLQQEVPPEAADYIMLQMGWTD